MRRYLPPLGAVAGLYALNRFALIPVASGPVHTLASCWLNDFLAGGAMLCVLDGALAAAHRPPVARFLPAAAFLLACGLFWEVATPLYLPRSVPDPWDVAAVLLGGAAMWKLLRRGQTKANR